MMLKAIKFIKSNKGLTLIEVLAVVTILGIIAGITVPSVASIIDKSKESVCYVNRDNLERMYKLHLVIENTQHSEVLFSKFMNEFDGEICSHDGVVSYDEGFVNCSVHPRENNVSEEDVGVPFF